MHWKRTWTCAGAALLVMAQLVAAQPVEFESIGMGPTRVYRPGAWSEVRGEVANPAAAEQTALIALSIEQMNQTHFVTRVWMPPRSRRSVQMPVRLDVQVPANERAWPASAQLIGVGRAGETSLTTNEMLLLVNHDRITTALAVRADSHDRDTAVRRLVRAVRELDSSLGTGTSGVNPDSMPEHPAALDPIDTLMLAVHDPALSIAQLDALRQWVLGGGRLWIMLDQTPAAVGDALFGEDWGVSELDRVELTEFSIDRGGVREQRAYDYPLIMSRVVADGWEVIHTVGGYPASMRRAIGHGEVYVTTLAAAAWVGDDEKAGESLRQLRGWLRAPESRQRAGAHQASFEQFVQHQIGWTVPGLGPVSAVLGAYLLALAGAGLWLMRRDRLEWLSVVGVVVAVVVAVGLSALGLARQREIPTTLAVAQVGYFHDDQPYVALDNRVSIYTSPGEGRELLMRGDAGLAQPNLAGQGGTILRHVHVPPRGWQLERLNLATSGKITDVRHAQTKPLHRAASAVVGWDPSGRIVGRLEGAAPGTLEDAVVASPDARLALEFNGNQFTSSLDHVLAGNDFIRALGFTQSQQARLQVYRSLFADPDFAQRTSVIGWAEPIDPGLQLADGVARVGSGIFSLPLRYDRPPSGGRLVLPFPLLRMEPLRNVPGVATTSIFDDRTRSFVEDITQEGDVVMRFTLPRGLMPLKLEQVRLDFTINALGRDVQPLTYHDAATHTVGPAVTSPIQPQSITLAGDDLPTLSPDGWFAVGVRVGPPVPGQAGKWTLRSLQAHVTATALPGESP